MDNEITLKEGLKRFSKDIEKYRKTDQVAKPTANPASPKADVSVRKLITYDDLKILFKKELKLVVGKEVVLTDKHKKVFDFLLKRFFINYNKGVVLMSGTGFGKTSAFKAIANTFKTLSLGKFEVINVGILANKCRRLKSLEPVYLLQNVKFLVLDDIGIEAEVYIDPFTKEVFNVVEYLVSYRSFNNLITSFTTNLTKEEIFEKYESRIYSRLLSCDFCEVQPHENLWYL